MSVTETTPTAHAVDLSLAQEFAQKVIGAWNSHQPDQLLALMTDDVVYDDSGWPKQMRGHAEVREFLESTWRAAPDLAFELIDGSLVDPPRLGRRTTGTLPRRTRGHGTRRASRPLGGR